MFGTVLERSLTMKRLLALILCLSLICITACADAEVLYKNGVVTITDAPVNATAIAVAYKDDTLEKVKIQKMAENNQIDISSFLDSADTFKVFLWDMNTIAPLCDVTDLTEDMKNESLDSDNSMVLNINNIEFKAVLEDNNTAKAFKQMLPTTLNMSELNGNEKYNYLSQSLPSNAEQIGRIEAGDIMLYGSSCVVLFYESFNTSYSYTKIGHIENPIELKSAVGAGSVQVLFQ